MNDADTEFSTELSTAAFNAWIYGLPLIEFAQTRHAIVAAQLARGVTTSVNHLTHGRRLVNAKNRVVTAPNVDTIYSSAFIDLSGGPVTLSLPAAGDRYLSLHLMDAYTNSFCILGTRTTGPSGGTFILAGPTDPAPVGAIRSPTPSVWAVLRVLVDDDDDYPAANRIQDETRVTGPTAALPEQYALRDAPWNEYFTSVQKLIIENPPPATDKAFFDSVSVLGLAPDGGFDADRFSPAEVAEIEAGVKRASEYVRSAGMATRAENGWTYPAANLGDWGQDYRARGLVALSGLGALPPVEATYCGSLTPDGQGFFTDDRCYRLHLDADKMPPARAFWSLTMYERLENGQSFLVGNRLDRYAIRDRTRGLTYNDDGSLDIWIAREDPGGNRTTNWLPAPSEGAYHLSMRCYLAEPELINGTYRLPPIEPA
ncbi:MAG: DUF1254 domain-containing protein [Pseudomonadota bacterium]